MSSSELRLTKVEVNGQPVECVTSPKRRGSVPVVFRYGHLADNESYEPWMTACLEAANVHVIGIPTPGFGTCPPLLGGWCMPGHVAFQTAAMRALGVRGPVILAAHSAAGALQIEWAAANPSRVAGIIGVNIIGEPVPVSRVLTPWRPALSLTGWYHHPSSGVRLAGRAVRMAASHPLRIIEASLFWDRVDVREAEEKIATAGIPIVIGRSKYDRIADRPSWKQQCDRTNATPVVLAGDHWVGLWMPEDALAMNRDFLQSAVRVARAMRSDRDVDRMSLFHQDGTPVLERTLESSLVTAQ